MYITHIPPFSGLFRCVMWFETDVLELRIDLSSNVKLSSFFWTAWPFKMGAMAGPETSVLNHLTLRNNPESGRIQFNHGKAYGLVYSTRIALCAVLVSLWWCSFGCDCARFMLIQSNYLVSSGSHESFTWEISLSAGSVTSVSSLKHTQRRVKVSKLFRRFQQK
jgi:hypothetical protein